MEDEVPVIPGIPPHAAANHRRAMIQGLIVGAVALAILAPFGHVLAGAFVFVGLGLGALNSHLVQRSVARFAANPAGIRKKQFVGNVLYRLGLITLIVLAIVFLVRPDGLGVLAGLAGFQLLMVGNASVPVIKELRKA